MGILCGKYGYTPDSEDIDSRLRNIAANIDDFKSPEVLKECFALMDVTTLHTDDTEASVIRMVEKVNALRTDYPDYPMPASICVFPNFASTVASHRADPSVHVTTVSGCFPSSQSFLEVKVRECELAVEEGADEVDIVLALNSFKAGDYESASNEISAMKSAILKKAAESGRPVILKVILETGLLSTPEAIAEASFLAMESGADFIKTSTGKVSVNATPMAAFVMCECIKAYYAKTGVKVGFKAAGGISDAMDAVSYYSIVSSVLGKEWLDKKYFRFGVSRLANALMTAIEQKTVTVF
ncbi:MAG: deoxyribose-phosphate aldolase [Bacteroidia bacterium]|nr:deoxyribose-phosphate aldolase [Bacteroidia bacterium]